MTHAELRTRLAGYAEGTLPAPEANEIRAHLTEGCDECLRVVFMRPVGLPRPMPTRARIPWSAVAAVLAAAGAGLAAGAVLMARSPVRSQPMGAADDGLAREVAALRASVEANAVKTTEAMARLEGRVAASVEANARPEDRSAGVPPTAQPGGEAAGAAPGAEPERVPAWLSELLSTDGVRVVSLRASAVAPTATGYALWSPTRGVVVVSAEGLPTGQATYRVRVELSDRATVWVGDLEQESGAPLVVTVAIPDGQGRRVRAVDLYREPPGSTALSARWVP